MIVALSAAVVLVLLTTLVHYECLRLVSDTLPKLTMSPRSRILLVVVGAFFAHTVEVWLYAGGLYFLAHETGLGGLAGETKGAFLDYLYYSTVTYTSLGPGEVWPVGALRLLTGVESLNGLVMIGWTTSFTYLAMREFWDLHPRRRRRRAEAGGGD